MFLLLAAIANFILIFAHIGYYAHGEADAAAEAYGMKIQFTPPIESEEDIAAWVQHKELENPENTVGLGANTFHTIHFVMILLNSIYLVVLIFLFKDRNRQMRLGYMGIVMLMVQIVLATLVVMNLPDFTNERFGLDASEGSQYGPRAELLLVILAMIFTWMAVRRIKKDEKMVRDADRLR